MTPPDERHYEALSRIDTEIKYISRMIDDHIVGNKEEHTSIKSMLDAIKYDLEMCPHAKLTQTEKQIESLWSWIKIIILAGGSTLTGVIISIITTLLKEH
jgi:hypothetical protein